MKTKTGIFLINLGTPSGSDTKSVRRYLREFLSDPRVIDLPPLTRWVLLNAFILPFRPRKSAAAYQQIWTESGSPLLIHSNALKDSLACALGNDFQVSLGMRYGAPTLESAAKELEPCENIIILPLFPQYSSAATGSAIQKALAIITAQKQIPRLLVKPDFYNHPAFIKSLAQLIKQQVPLAKMDYLLFSYHGLPLRQITTCKVQTKPLAHCHDEDCHCYRAQCYLTAQLLAQEIGLGSEQYGVAFQSRLGKTPWIQPYTDKVLPELISQGIRNLIIVSPSFVSDCLETLEELGIRAREQWQHLGGHNFTLVSSLNNDTGWVKALAEMIREF